MNWSTGLLSALLLLAAAGCQQPQAPVTFTLCRTGLPTEGNWKGEPKFVDFNADGRLDLVAQLRQGGGPGAWIGNGDGTWTPADEGLAFDDLSCGGGVAFGDLNEDGALDLAVADHCQGLFVYLGDGTGRWTMITEALNPPPPARDELPRGAIQSDYKGHECVDIADFDGDGHLDLVAGACDKGGIQFYLGDGTGANWTYRSLPEVYIDRWALRIRALDLNNDGHLDIVANCEEGPRVWFGTGPLQFRPSHDGLPEPMIGGIYRGLAIGDVNEDGLPDIITGNHFDGPEVYLQRPDEYWQKLPDIFPKLLGGAEGVAVGDVDHDGHLDVLVSGRMGQERGHVFGVFLLLGDGTGKFAYAENTGLPASRLAQPWGAQLGDVNGDGVLDAVVAGGGVTATNPEHAETVLDAGLMLWCTELHADDARGTK